MNESEPRGIRTFNKQKNLKNIVKLQKISVRSGRKKEERKLLKLHQFDENTSDLIKK